MNEQKPTAAQQGHSIDQLPGRALLPDAGERIPLGSGLITALISKDETTAVYEIWNSDLKVKRAVKLLASEHTREFDDRIFEEVKITARLHHDNIVRVHALGKWKGLTYIETERTEGRELDRLISERGRLPVAACTAAAVMLARALDYAHTQTYVVNSVQYSGIIHHDIKPGNIVILDSGIVKLADFGLSKLLSALDLKTKGFAVSRVQYLSPEQIQDEEVDGRSDLYSLAVVLYEMLTGVRAFREPKLSQIISDKVSNKYAALERFRLKIPSALCNLVKQCMHCDPAKRIQSASEFLGTIVGIHGSITDLPPEQVLASFIKQERAARPTGIPRRSEGAEPWKWVVAGSAVIAVAALILVVSELVPRRKSLDTAPPRAAQQLPPPPASSPPANKTPPAADASPNAAAMLMGTADNPTETREEANADANVNTSPAQPSPPAQTLHAAPAVRKPPGPSRTTSAVSRPAAVAPRPSSPPARTQQATERVSTVLDEINSLLNMNRQREAYLKFSGEREFLRTQLDPQTFANVQSRVASAQSAPAQAPKPPKPARAPAVNTNDAKTAKLILDEINVYLDVKDEEQAAQRFRSERDFLRKNLEPAAFSALQARIQEATGKK